MLAKIKTLMVVRLALVTMIMIAGPFVLKIEKTPFYIIFAVFYFSTLIYAVLLKTKLSVYIQGYLQIIVDTVLETAIIHYTGGVDSVYAFLYAPSIVASGVVISRHAAKAIAGLSSVLYGVLSGLEYLGVIQPVYAAGTTYTIGLRAVVLIVSFRIVIFCLVGYLSSYLASRLFQETVELQRLRNLRDIILKNISSGVLTFDPASCIVYANPKVQEILGKREGEIVGFPWPNLIWKEPNQEIINRFIISARQPGGVEIDIVQPIGRKLILSFSYADIMDEKNKAIGGVITFVDITPLKELELEVCQREKLSMMGEVAVGMAHEIRNPLGSIRGALEVLKEKGHFKEEADKLVDVIFKESDRLNNVIEDFLKCARERKGAMKYETLGELIDEVWLLIKQDRRWHKGIGLEKVLSSSQGLTLEIDPSQLRQVFYNLFINSLEAMPRGGKIVVDIREDSGKVTITVKDNGIGIPKEEQGKIFQRFYSTKSYGLGMGLSITRRIIESHRGTIGLESEEGKGTTVKIVLPR